MIESGLVTCTNGGKMRETKSRVFSNFSLDQLLAMLLCWCVLFDFSVLFSSFFYFIFRASNFAFLGKISRSIHWVESSKQRANFMKFKIWRRQRQRQRHKSMISLVEWRKIIVLQGQHAFGAMFWRSLPNDKVKFSYLRFWRQRELAAVNLSLFAFTWKPFVPSKRKCTPPILYDVTNME